VSEHPKNVYRHSIPVISCCAPSIFEQSFKKMEEKKGKKIVLEKKISSIRSKMG
jgi:hypothetical protein